MDLLSAMLADPLNTQPTGTLHECQVPRVLCAICAAWGRVQLEQTLLRPCMRSLSDNAIYGISLS